MAETPQQLAVTLRADARRVKASVPAALRAVGFYLVGKVRQGFDQSRDPWGRPWAPLKYRKGKPLLNRGVLMTSFAYSVAGNTVRVGSSSPHAAVHDAGATVKVPEKRRAKPWVFKSATGQTVFTRRIRAHAVVIPQRSMFGWSPEWAAGANKVAGDVLAKAAGAS